MARKFPGGRLRKPGDTGYSYPRKITQREVAALGDVEIQPRRLRVDPKKTEIVERKAQKQAIQAAGQAKRRAKLFKEAGKKDPKLKVSPREENNQATENATVLPDKFQIRFEKGEISAEELAKRRAQRLESLRSNQARKAEKRAHRAAKVSPQEGLNQVNESSSDQIHSRETISEKTGIELLDREHLGRPTSDLVHSYLPPPTAHDYTVLRNWKPPSELTACVSQRCLLSPGDFYCSVNCKDCMPQSDFLRFQLDIGFPVEDKNMLGNEMLGNVLD